MKIQKNWILDSRFWILDSRRACRDVLSLARRASSISHRASRIILILALLSIVFVQPFATSAAQSEAALQPTRYMIIITGGELLNGAYADGHTHFLTRTLRPLGLQCVGSMCVDDKQADIKETLRFASDKAALVIVTGGLGPTDNDITREALSDFTGIPLKEHPDVLEQMSRRFGVPPAELRANLRRQTRTPTQGSYLKNSNGTAVGLIFESTGRVVVALPGPPRELQPMVRDELVPYLSRRFGTHLPGLSLTLRFVGLGQSQIDQTLKDHVPLPSDVTIASQFEGSRVDFTFSLPHDTPQDQSRLRELEQKIMTHLGQYVYADDETSLEECVLKLAEKRGVTLALAEAGSGGALAAALSGAEGEHKVLSGAYVAPTEEKLRRLLAIRDEDWASSKSPAQRAQRLAAAVAEVTKSSWAIAISERSRDQKGADYVTVAFKMPGGRDETKQLQLRGQGELARANLSTQLLDELRRKLN